MTVPGNSPLILTLLALFLASTGYAGGRLHQWYRMGHDRDEAFRDGYDTATRSVFTLAARAISPRRADRSDIRASAAVVLPSPAVTAAGPAGGGQNTAPDCVRLSQSGAVPVPSEAVPVESSGRHTVPDELVRAATYRLTADRVARAKVPGVAVPGVVPPVDQITGDGAPRPGVPKPRSS
jgi:hypothetical protein